MLDVFAVEGKILTTESAARYHSVLNMRERGLTWSPTRPASTDESGLFESDTSQIRADTL
jgi:hypothetical protein